MNRTIKGTLAVTAAVALLAGAGGTFSEWRESQDVGGGELTAGQLEMAVSEVTWTDVTGGGSTVIDPATFRMVPGDTVRYTATITPTLEGDNLEATLVADIAGASGDLVGDDGVSDVSVQATLDGSTGPMALTAAESGVAVPVTVTISMPFDEGGDDVEGPGDGDAGDGEQETLDLTSLTLSLVQTPNPPVTTP